MNSSHTNFLPRGSWIQRLAMLAAGCIAMAASAATVEVVNNGTSVVNCTWSSITGDANSIKYTCGSAQTTTGGNFTLTVPTSLAISAAGQSGAYVTRNGGTIAIDVAVSTSGGGCTADAGTLSWANNETANVQKPFTISTAASGTCNVGITVPPEGTGTTSRAITLVNPDANVVFTFELATISDTNFGAQPTTIKVKRGGGTNGRWTVPFTLSGFLTNAAAGSVTANGAAFTGTTGSLNFPAGSSEASVVFTPVATVPAGFTLPAAGSLSIAAPVAGTIPANQTASIPSPAVRSFQLVVLTGCPTLQNVRNFAFTGPSQPVNGFAGVTIQPGQVASFPMIPQNMTAMANNGYVSIIQSAASPQAASVEMWFSKCPGDLGDSLRQQVQTNQYGVAKKPCVAAYNYTGGPIYWSTMAGNVNTCLLNAGGGPYYVNYRHVKSDGITNSCPNATCTNVSQMNVQ